VNRAFADTSYLLALVNWRDGLHDRAVAMTGAIPGPIVTTAWVITELLDAFSQPPSRSRVMTFVRDCYADPRFVVVPPTRQLFHAGMDLFERRDDKDWSLTDCISFVVMEEEELADALTADHHFRQAGFHILL
jgi:uncharacterized protein